MEKDMTMEPIRIMRVRWWQILLMLGLMAGFLTVSIVDSVRISKLNHRINEMQLNQEEDAQTCSDRCQQLETLQNKVEKDILNQICTSQKEATGVLEKEMEAKLIIAQGKVDSQILIIQKRLDESRKGLDGDRELVKQELEADRQRLVALRMTLNNMDDKIKEGSDAFKVHMKEMEEGGKYWMKKFAEIDKALAALKKVEVKKDK